METQYYYLKAPNIYLFWNKEDPKPYLDITIVRKILREGDKERFPASFEQYSGYSYHEKYGWDVTYWQTVEFSKNHFDLICMLDELGSVEITERMRKFFRNAIKDLFEKDDFS